MVVFLSENGLKADTDRKKDEGNLVLMMGQRNMSGSQKGKQPLYIMDGKEVKESVFRSKKPDDIERIEVFKDSEALARYGKKGEHGVVVVTLKGSAGIVGKDPLIILDGKEIDKHTLDLLDKQQIASINILKNEHATKAYGAKGINGVIQIISKKAGRDTERP